MRKIPEHHMRETFATCCYVGTGSSGAGAFHPEDSIHKVVDNLAKGSEAASDSKPICPNEWPKARATGALTCINAMPRSK
jgi:hypothetical protein